MLSSSSALPACRQEALLAMAAARSHRTGPESFLTRQATRRAQLRRQSSSRKLQAAWRAFCEQQQTTQALAQGFAATGVPFRWAIPEPPSGCCNCSAKRCSALTVSPSHFPGAVCRFRSRWSDPSCSPPCQWLPRLIQHLPEPQTRVAAPPAQFAGVHMAKFVCFVQKQRAQVVCEIC